MKIAAGVIAAGLGSRLEPKFAGTPKPLIPVGAKPLAHWIVEGLSRAGVDRLTILTNSRGGAVPASLTANFSGMLFNFLTADTDSSFASFRIVAETLARTEEDFLMSTVDALVDPADIARFLSECRAARADAGIAITAFVDDENPLWVDAENGRAVAIGDDATQRKTASCGLYYLTRAAARRLAAEPHHARLRDFWRALVQNSPDVAAPLLSKTLDVDRPEDVASAELLAGRRTA